MFTPQPFILLIERTGLERVLFLQVLSVVMQVLSLRKKPGIVFKRSHLTVAILFLVMMAHVNAQQTGKEPQLKTISNELVVKGSVEEVWSALASFGNVSSFLSTIDESYPLNGSRVIAAEGSERESMVPDGLNNIIYKERVTDIVEGSYYTYEVYDSENFTLNKMIVTFGVTSDKEGRTILYSRMRYKMNSVLMTHFLRRKLNKINFNSLIGYKYYVETGEKNSDIKSLRRRYFKEEQGIPDHELIADNGLPQ
jgi:hypothetical protein